MTTESVRNEMTTESVWKLWEQAPYNDEPDLVHEEEWFSEADVLNAAREIEPGPGYYLNVVRPDGTWYQYTPAVGNFP